jgi:hypothetical protein
MKTTFKSILLATLGVFAFTCCEDVPAPYQLPGTGDKPQESSFYSSTSCADWSMLAAASGNNPWSQGSSYTQATGYQKWDGAAAKSNRMADGYLISPGFSTVTDKGAAYITFQYCVGYASNDAQFADHIKLYASTQYAPADGFVAEKWTQLDWKATHTSTNWELATTNVVLPAEFVNKEKVNIAFYFTTPNDTKSVTFEIKEFKAVAGTPASEGGEGGQGEGTEVTCAQAVELTNALADGATSAETYTVTGYITEVFGNVSRNQQSFWMADTKDGGQVFEAYWANLPEGVSAFTVGSKVKITGQLIKYVKDGKVTPEIKNATVVIIEAGEGGEGGEGGGGETSEYSIDLSYTGGTNFYDNGIATINNVADCKVLKIGTSKAAGDFTVTVPAGKHSFYAITWKGGDAADVVLKNGDEVLETVTVQPNDGATSNSPYTITVTEDDKYEFEVSEACTITVTSDKRVIFFGIK